MKKSLLLVLMIVLALGLAPMISHADEHCTDAGIGTVCNEDGVITADGNADNPAILGGYVQVDTNNGRVCADDNGSPDNSESPTCLPE